LRINSNQLWDVTHLQSFVSFTQHSIAKKYWALVICRLLMCVTSGATRVSLGLPSGTFWGTTASC